ncbi:hypothetical protein TH63_00350 [Rufibacter radiotolerans]|uniref:DUF4833 domain-containing protein n=1 Tax=Rufibacter radiotolerans TaxID=1379910 RepID=A0A0H4VFN9_9BACT|nr:hypothetical protein [Rufibacter radiotolerans]AKQ44435.1 hypothetical protein TH63_00350 [Rufibacter radiotolerans]
MIFCTAAFRTVTFFTLLLFTPLISFAQFSSESEAKDYFTKSKSLDPIEGVYLVTQTNSGASNSVRSSRYVISRNAQEPGFFHMQLIDEANNSLRILYANMKKIDEQLYVYLIKMDGGLKTVYYTITDKQFTIKYDSKIEGLGPIFYEYKYTKILPK